VDFRGVVRAELQIQEDAPCSPGQRVFSGVMLPTKVVPVCGPPLLHYVSINAFRARFADGTPVSSQPKDNEIGLWLLNSESPERYSFYVGTQQDYQKFNLFSSSGSGEEKRSSGGKSGGRGRGGRHGGASASDSSGSGTTP